MILCNQIKAQTTKERHMGQVICKWNMLYKVCNGLRNFGTKKAKIIAGLTNTNPMIWMDSDYAGYRKQYQEKIEEALNITRPTHKHK
jgi:hypothetical protein